MTSCILYTQIMSSNKTIFAGYCCRLVRTDHHDTQAEPQTSCQAYGTMVKLSGLPLDSKQLDQQLPGLSLMKSVPTTEYALVTTHSLIPKSSHLSLWKFSEEFPVARKALDKYVSATVSCCGEESGFVIPGPTTAREHGGKMCNLGLNFTVLFLNEKFKQHYCTHYGSQPNPPCVDISQCKADIDLVCKYLHLPQAQECELVQDAGISTEPCLSSNSSGSFEVIAGVSANDKVSMSAVELSVTDDSKRSQQNPSELSLHQSNLKLAQDIVTFQKVKSVQCKGSSHLCVGMPLVYMSTDGQESSKLIGVLTGDGQALILSSLFHLLQGNPSTCLSLLVFTEMWRLWTYKWSHLLLPYLENHPAQPKLILEILIILLEKKDENKEHFLSTSSRDNPDIRLGFLKFLKVLFHHFDGQCKEAITRMTEGVCLQAGLPVDNFLSEISGLCESLLSIAKYCCDYQDMEKNPKIMALVEHCFICANEMLSFQHEQDVIEHVLCTEKFETALNCLQSECPQSSVILSKLIAFYRKLHAPCKKILASTTQELQCYKAKLASCKQENEDLQTKCSELQKQYDMSSKKCQSFKTQYSEASDSRKKALNTLADSQKRQYEMEGKRRELKAENEDLKQQLMSERESKQKVEADNQRLREDNRRLEEDKRKLNEDNVILRDDKVNFKKENDDMKSQIEVLKYQANQQRESGHAMQRTMSDLSGMVHQIQCYLSDGQQSAASQDGRESQSAARGVSRKHNTQSDSSVVATSRIYPFPTSCTVPAATVTATHGCQDHSDDKKDTKLALKGSTATVQLAQATTQPPQSPPSPDNKSDT